MSKRLIALNAVFAVIAIAAVGYIVRELRVKPSPVTVRSAAAPTPVTAPAPPPQALAGSYGIVASRNLFSPTRSESAASNAAATAALPKPFLYGILLRDDAPVAYLEDPATKRVAGYRLGDSVAGGTLKQISGDQVVLNRPEGDVSVRLRDPSKPRPAPVATPAQPGTQTGPGGRVTQPFVPGSVPPQPGQTPGGQVVQSPAAPGTAETPAALPRRPLPPNLLRRLPPSATDAPAQQ